MKVLQILQSKNSNDVETIKPNATVTDAIARLAERKIGALVVSDHSNGILGIISERDIVRSMAEGGAARLSQSVHELMTQRVETCAPDETALSVLGRMTSGRFRHMPVMDNNKMVGLLSIGDVVKARINEIERENAAMADMLHG